MFKWFLTDLYIAYKEIEHRFDRMFKWFSTDLYIAYKKIEHRLDLYKLMHLTANTKRGLFWDTQGCNPAHHLICFWLTSYPCNPQEPSHAVSLKQKSRTCYLVQSQYTETGLTSSSTDCTEPVAWHSCYKGSEPQVSSLEANVLPLGHRSSIKVRSCLQPKRQKTDIQKLKTAPEI